MGDVWYFIPLDNVSSTSLAARKTSISVRSSKPKIEIKIQELEFNTQ